MADTGFIFPGSTVGDRTIAGAVSSWVDHANITADDGADAHVSLVISTSRGLAGTNFDFSVIPAGATIDGIEVRIGGYHAVGVTTDVLRLILADDSDGSENKNAALASWVSGDVTDEVGGFSDLWGETITRADVQDIDWGAFIGVEAGFVTAFVDSIQMRVFYTAAAGGVGPRSTVGRGICRGNFRGVA